MRGNAHRPFGFLYNTPWNAYRVGNMSMPNRRKPPHTRKTPTRELDTTGGPRIQWLNLVPMLDFWGQEIQRFYKLETLANATEWMMRTQDRFIMPTLQEVMGPSAITSLVFELFQEGKYQLIFRLQAFNLKRKRYTFGFVVSKHEGLYSDVARGEHANLRVLNERAPNWVVRPFKGGTIFLPDRHQRKEHGREVYAYLTQWLSGFHELGVNRDLQFYMNVAKPHTFTIAQTEELKARMVELIARTYDAGRGDCMDMPQVASGDFVVTSPIPGPAKLKLIACRRISRHVTPVKFIHRLVATTWDWGGKAFRIAPTDLSMLYAGLARGRGQEEADIWLDQYRVALEKGKVPLIEPWSLDDWQEARE